MKNQKPKKVKSKFVGVSVRQQALADEILKNQMRPVSERKNKTELAKAAGFTSPAAFKSSGLKIALEKYGLNEDLVTSALVDDIESKPGKRLGELTLAANILGMIKKDGQEGNKTLVVVVSGQSAERYGIQSAGN